MCEDQKHSGTIKTAAAEIIELSEFEISRALPNIKTLHCQSELLAGNLKRQFEKIQVPQNEFAAFSHDKSPPYSTSSVIAELEDITNIVTQVNIQG